MKAVEYDDGFVTWELRRVLDAIDCKSQENVKYARRQKIPTMKSHAVAMGVTIDDSIIIPSRKAALAQGVDLGGDGDARYIQQEFTMSTKHLVSFVLLDIKVSSGRRRGLVEALWMGLCKRCLPPEVLDFPIVLDVATVDGAVCREGRPLGGCSHVNRVRQALVDGAAAAGPPQARLGQAVIEIMRGDIACPHIGKWFEDFCEAIVGPIREQLPAAAKANALESSSCFGPKKRRRIDEHMKEAIVTQVKQQRLAANAPSWARATGKANPKSMHRVRDEYLGAYHYAARQAFADCTTVKLALDGARLGEPQEEYFIGVVENCETSLAAWAPPAVPWVGRASPLERCGSGSEESVWGSVLAKKFDRRVVDFFLVLRTSLGTSDRVPTARQTG